MKSMSNIGRTLALLQANPMGMYAKEIRETLGLTQKQFDSVVDPNKKNAQFFLRFRDPGVSSGKWSSTRCKFFAAEHADNFLKAPELRVFAKSKAPKLDSAAKVIGGNMKPVVCGHSTDNRFTVRELPAGYVSKLNPAESRAWVEAVV